MAGLLAEVRDRVSEEFKKIQLADAAILPAPKIIEESAANVYDVEGGKSEEDFQIEQPPDIPDPAIVYPSLPPGAKDVLFEPVKFATTMVPGAWGYEEYMERQKAAQLIAPPIPGKEKNLIDRFFDWLNKILSGK